ncbi:MAG: hypothetical protein JNK41_12640 [Saprospiraceae bacterium]|nr:hypothetical protein [Saprospiraceae bacterium]
MEIKYNELIENGYYLVDKLDHKELIPFIRKYIKLRTFSSNFYVAANLIVFLTILFLFWW